MYLDYLCAKKDLCQQRVLISKNSIYETCSGARDLKEFCKDSGVNYNKFIEWQRKQLCNEKLGRSSSRMIPITVVDSPANTDSQQANTSLPTIRFVEVKFSDEVSIRRFNMSVEVF